jgi:antitoxin component of MazEF toxin-antitoxin module
MHSRGKVAKKFALYPPKKAVELLNLKEGQAVAYEVAGQHLIVKPILDPLELAVKSKKWAKTSVQEFEAESSREQDELSH